MAFLRTQLDDTPAPPCGRCDNCTGVHWEVDLDRQLIAQAAQHLRRTDLPIEPRVQWPTGFEERRGNINPDLRLEAGRCLSVDNDGGWGWMVRRAKHDGAPFADMLIEAAADLVRRWATEPGPEWITYVPSTTSPDLVPDFARRLGALLGLEVRDVVRRVRESAPQKEMENSAQQFRNAYGAFEVVMPLPATPVLLIDDMVDSRWTLTCVGVALREAGSGPVFPFVLARAVSD